MLEIVSALVLAAIGAAMLSEAAREPAVTPGTVPGPDPPQTPSVEPAVTPAPGQDPTAVTPPAVATMTDAQIAEIADPALRAQATQLKSGWDKSMRELSDQRKTMEADEVVKYVRELRELAGTEPGEVARRLRAEADYFDPPSARSPAASAAPAAGTNGVDAQLQQLGLPPSAEMSDVEKRLVQLVTGLAGEVSTLRGGRVNDQIDSQLAALRQTHGKAFDEAAEKLVLETAAKYKLDDLQAAYRIANFDGQKAAGTAEAYAALKEKGLAVEPPTVQRPATDTEPTTVDEILNREADKLGIPA